MTDLGKVRVVQPRDLGMLLEWRNHPNICRFMFRSTAISKEEHFEWYRQQMTDVNSHILIVEIDRPVGFVKFQVESSKLIGHWGFYVDPHAPKGTGFTVCRTALNYAFSELGFMKVAGRVLDFNIRSLQLHRRLGFVEEGRMREEALDGRKVHSVIYLGLLGIEWMW